MDSIYGNWTKGVDYYKNKQYDLAEKAYKSDQLTSKIYFNLGMVYMCLKQWDKAIEAFDSSTKCDKYLALAYFQKGVCELLTKRYDDSIQSWQSAADILNNNETIDYGGLHLDYILCKSEIFVNIALAYYYKGNDSETETYLIKANTCNNVKDDIDELKRQMQNNQSIFPCSVDDTAIFHPPRLPPELQKAIKEAQSGNMFRAPPKENNFNNNTVVKQPPRLIPSRPAPTLPQNISKSIPQGMPSNSPPMPSQPMNKGTSTNSTVPSNPPPLPPQNVNKNPPPLPPQNNANPPRFKSPPRKQSVVFPRKISVTGQKEVPTLPKKPVSFGIRTETSAPPPPVPAKNTAEILNSSLQNNSFGTNKPFSFKILAEHNSRKIIIEQSFNDFDDIINTIRGSFGDINFSIIEYYDNDFQEYAEFTRYVALDKLPNLLKMRLK